MGLCFTSLLSPSDPNSTSLKSLHFSSGKSSNFSAISHPREVIDGSSGSIDDGGTQSQELVAAAAAQHVQILERPNLKVFSFRDLKSATKSFNSGTWLGDGAFGRVYKGWLDENTLKPAKSGTGMVVAIKKLKPGRTECFQEWQSEVNFLGRLSHPNLVKLLGYCWDEDELLLVYEFLPKGSLKNYLLRRNHNIEPLSWNIRIKIAIGAARGLAFLHTLEKPVIHRDFQASSILLDLNYNAKISNFGLARLGPPAGESHVSTRVMGTCGYAAPEYILTGHLYVKSDVYSFGMVLLEMLTGMPAYDGKWPTMPQDLVEWVKPCLYNEKKLKTIMDVRIEGQYSFKAALQAAQLSLKCLEDDPKNRPSMKDVVETLEGISGQINGIQEPQYEVAAFQHPQQHNHARQRVTRV